MENSFLDEEKSTFVDGGNRSTRLSILKPPKLRLPLKDVNFGESPDDTEDLECARKRRVSFAGVNSIKEFCSNAESLQVCHVQSYEEAFSSSDNSNNSCFVKALTPSHTVQPGDDRNFVDDAMDLTDSMVNVAGGDGPNLHPGVPLPLSKADEQSVSVTADTSCVGQRGIGTRVSTSLSSSDMSITAHITRKIGGDGHVTGSQGLSSMEITEPLGWLKRFNHLPATSQPDPPNSLTTKSLDTDAQLNAGVCPNVQNLPVFMTEQSANDDLNNVSMEMTKAVTKNQLSEFIRMGRIEQTVGFQANWLLSQTMSKAETSDMDLTETLMANPVSKAPVRINENIESNHPAKLSLARTSDNEKSHKKVSLRRSSHISSDMEITGVLSLTKCEKLLSKNDDEMEFTDMLPLRVFKKQRMSEEGESDVPAVGGPVTENEMNNENVCPPGADKGPVDLPGDSSGSNDALPFEFANNRKDSSPVELSFLKEFRSPEETETIKDFPRLSNRVKITNEELLLYSPPEVAKAVTAPVKGSSFVKSALNKPDSPDVDFDIIRNVKPPLESSLSSKSVVSFKDFVIDENNFANDTVTAVGVNDSDFLKGVNELTRTEEVPVVRFDMTSVTEPIIVPQPRPDDLNSETLGPASMENTNVHKSRTILDCEDMDTSVSMPLVFKPVVGGTLNDDAGKQSMPVLQFDDSLQPRASAAHGRPSVRRSTNSCSSGLMELTEVIPTKYKTTPLNPVTFKTCTSGETKFPVQDLDNKEITAIDETVMKGDTSRDSSAMKVIEECDNIHQTTLNPSSNNNFLQCHGLASRTPSNAALELEETAITDSHPVHARKSLTFDGMKATDSKIATSVQSMNTLSHDSPMLHDMPTNSAELISTTTCPSIEAKSRKSTVNCEENTVSDEIYLNDTNRCSMNMSTELPSNAAQVSQDERAPTPVEGTAVMVDEPVPTNVFEDTLITMAKHVAANDQSSGCFIPSFTFPKTQPENDPPFADGDSDMECDVSCMSNKTLSYSADKLASRNSTNNPVFVRKSLVNPSQERDSAPDSTQGIPSQAPDSQTVLPSRKSCIGRSSHKESNNPDTCRPSGRKSGFEVDVNSNQEGTALQSHKHRSSTAVIEETCSNEARRSQHIFPHGGRKSCVGSSTNKVFETHCRKSEVNSDAFINDTPDIANAAGLAKDRNNARKSIFQDTACDEAALTSNELSSVLSSRKSGGIQNMESNSRKSIQVGVRKSCVGTETISSSVDSPDPQDNDLDALKSTMTSKSMETSMNEASDNNFDSQSKPLRKSVFLSNALNETVTVNIRSALAPPRLSCGISNMEPISRKSCQLEAKKSYSGTECLDAASQKAVPRKSIFVETHIDETVGPSENVYLDSQPQIKPMRKSIFLGTAMDETMAISCDPAPPHLSANRKSCGIPIKVASSQKNFQFEARKSCTGTELRTNSDDGCIDAASQNALHRKSIHMDETMVDAPNFNESVPLMDSRKSFEIPNTEQRSRKSLKFEARKPEIETDVITKNDECLGPLNNGGLDSRPLNKSKRKSIFLGTAMDETMDVSGDIEPLHLLASRKSCGIPMKSSPEKSCQLEARKSCVGTELRQNSDVSCDLEDNGCLNAASQSTMPQLSTLTPGETMNIDSPAISSNQRISLLSRKSCGIINAEVSCTQKSSQFIARKSCIGTESSSNLDDFADHQDSDFGTAIRIDKPRKSSSICNSPDKSSHQTMACTIPITLPETEEFDFTTKRNKRKSTIGVTTREDEHSATSYKDTEQLIEELEEEAETALYNKTTQARTAAAVEDAELSQNLMNVSLNESEPDDLDDDCMHASSTPYKSNDPAKPPGDRKRSYSRRGTLRSILSNENLANELSQELMNVSIQSDTKSPLHKKLSIESSRIPSVAPTSYLSMCENYMEHKRMLEEDDFPVLPLDLPYEIRVKNRDLLKTYGFRFLGQRTWEVPFLRETIGFVVVMPDCKFTESTIIESVRYSFHPHKVELVRILHMQIVEFVRRRLLRKYPEIWLKAECKEVKQLEFVVNSLKGEIDSMKSIVEKLVYIKLRFPCDLKDDKLSFRIASQEALRTFIVTIDLRNFHNMADCSVTVTNLIGEVNESAVQMIFRSLARNQNMLHEFVTTLQKCILRLAAIPV